MRNCSVRSALNEAQRNYGSVLIWLGFLFLLVIGPPLDLGRVLVAVNKPNVRLFAGKVVFARVLRDELVKAIDVSQLPAKFNRAGFCALANQLQHFLGKLRNGYEIAPSALITLRYSGYFYADRSCFSDSLMAWFCLPRKHAVEANLRRNRDTLVSKTYLQSRLRRRTYQYEFRNTNSDGSLLQSNGLLTGEFHLSQLRIHRLPLFSGVVGINAGSDRDGHSCESGPKSGARARPLDWSPNSVSYPRPCCKVNPIYSYFYGFLGAVLMFCGMVSIGVCGSCRQFKFGIIALSCAVLLIYGAFKVIYHALDLLDACEDNVTHNYRLTSPNYCNTPIAIGRQAMANVLSTDKQIAVISALAEGSS